MYIILSFWLSGVLVIHSFMNFICRLCDTGFEEKKGLIKHKVDTQIHLTIVGSLKSNPMISLQIELDQDEWGWMDIEDAKKDLTKFIKEDLES